MKALWWELCKYKYDWLHTAILIALYVTIGTCYQ